MEEKIKKINILYLLGYIFGPMAICAICFLISYLYFPKGNGAVILIMGPSLLSIIWWIFGGSQIYKTVTRKFEKELDSKGFNRNQTFYGKGKVVIIDANKGQIGLVFFWNPFKTYIIPASKVSKAWVDDGKSGVGIFEGSGRVSFLFTIDNVKVRVNTFTSNTRWRMDSEQILTGISKADMMVEVLETARKKG